MIAYFSLKTIWAGAVMLGRRRQQVLAGRRRQQIEEVFKADALGLRNMQLRGCLGAGCGQRRAAFSTEAGKGMPFTASAAMMEAKMSPGSRPGFPCGVHPAAAVNAAAFAAFSSAVAAPLLQEIKLMKSSCSWHAGNHNPIRSHGMRLSASAVSSSAVQPDSR